MEYKNLCIFFEIIWISPQFAVKVTEWVQQFIEGEDYQECQYNFEEDISFAALNSAANKKSKKKGRGGHNKKLYEVTPDCFKNMLTR